MAWQRIEEIQPSGLKYGDRRDPGQHPRDPQSVLSCNISTTCRPFPKAFGLGTRTVQRHMVSLLQPVYHQRPLPHPIAFAVTYPSRGQHENPEQIKCGDFRSTVERNRVWLGKYRYVSRPRSTGQCPSVGAAPHERCGTTVHWVHRERRCDHGCYLRGRTVGDYHVGGGWPHRAIFFLGATRQSYGDYGQLGLRRGCHYYPADHPSLEGFQSGTADACCRDDARSVC